MTIGCRSTWFQQWYMLWHSVIQRQTVRKTWRRTVFPSPERYSTALGVAARNCFNWLGTGQSSCPRSQLSGSICDFRTRRWRGCRWNRRVDMILSANSRHGATKFCSIRPTSWARAAVIEIISSLLVYDLVFVPWHRHARYRSFKTRSKLCHLWGVIKYHVSSDVIDSWPRWDLNGDNY